MRGRQSESSQPGIKPAEPFLVVLATMGKVLDKALSSSGLWHYFVACLSFLSRGA